MLTPTKSEVLETIEKIANDVTMSDNFCISHPSYKPFELSESVVERLQKMPESIQYKHQCQHLSNFLYGIYYNSSFCSLLSNSSNNDSVKTENIDGEDILDLDFDFYEKIHDSNQGHGYFDDGWVITQKHSAQLFSVSKDDLTIKVDPSQHLKDPLADQLGQEVAVLMPKNLVQNGFYMAVSDCGLNSYAGLGSDQDPQTARIYFNISDRGAMDLMSNLTHLFNQSSIYFTFKVLYNPESYVRHDAGVLYIRKTDFHQCRKLLSEIVRECQEHLKPEVPLFTKKIAPGVGVAEEPSQHFTDRESFGSNRCQIVANALVSSWGSTQDSVRHRIDTIAQHFAAMNLDLEYPYLNPKSEDIYFL
jgi:hypothetical protein